MDALEAIFTRRSIRKYTPRQVADDTVSLLLKAGMAAPTCVNNLDWQFVVIRGREHMEKIIELKPGNADMLREASAAIMVCGDMNLAYPGNPDYWIQDPFKVPPQRCLRGRLAVFPAGLLRQRSSA